MKYAVTYEEILSKTVIIDAESDEEATKIMNHLVNCEYIVLDSSNLIESYIDCNEPYGDQIEYLVHIDDELDMERVREHMRELEK